MHAPVAPTSVLYSNMDDAQYQEIAAQIKALIQKLDPELSDEDVDLAMMRVLMYAQREKAATKPKPDAP